jgi:GTPase Era involved in 16S rRNA processing
VANPLVQILKKSKVEQVLVVENINNFSDKDIKDLKRLIATKINLGLNLAIANFAGKEDIPMEELSNIIKSVLPDLDNKKYPIPQKDK